MKTKIDIKELYFPYVNSWYVHMHTGIRLFMICTVNYSIYNNNNKTSWPKGWWWNCCGSENFSLSLCQFVRLSVPFMFVSQFEQ